MNLKKANILRWLFIGIVAGVMIAFTAANWHTAKAIQIGNLIVLGLTLIAIIFYVADTYVIAHVTRMNYERSITPIITVHVKSPFEDKDGKWHFNVSARNSSASFARAFLDLGVKVNGEPVDMKPINPAYSGGVPWDLEPYLSVTGVISLGAVLRQKETDIHYMQQQASIENAKVRKLLTMDIDTWYVDDANRKLPRKRLLKHWWFDFRSMAWVYSVRESRHIAEQGEDG